MLGTPSILYVGILCVHSLTLASMTLGEEVPTGKSEDIMSVAAAIAATGATVLCHQCRCDEVNLHIASETKADR